MCACSSSLLHCAGEGRNLSPAQLFSLLDKTGGRSKDVAYARPPSHYHQPPCGRGAWFFSAMESPVQTRYVRKGAGSVSQPLSFSTGDWKSDSGLSCCSATTRGVWIELICSMHESHSGSITGTVDQLSRLARCHLKEMASAIDELEHTKTADIARLTNDRVTVACRRLIRKEELSKKRMVSGSKGGSTTASKREATPYQNNETLEGDFACVLLSTERDEEGKKEESNKEERKEEVEKDTYENKALYRVREFSKGEGIIQSDADWFFWKCESNGWTNGGKPILDWKATLRAWQRARYLPSQKRADRNPNVRVIPPSPTQPETYSPNYQKYRPPPPEMTEEEFEKAREVARKAAAEFRQQMRK